MSTLSDVRDGLTEALDRVDQLMVYRVVPDTIEGIVAAFLRPQSIEYDQTFGAIDERAQTLRMDVVMAVAMSDQRAQELLDEYVAVDGDRSIVAAIHDDRTLGGRFDSVRVISADQLGVLTIGDTPYYSQTVTIEVFA